MIENGGATSKYVTNYCAFSFPEPIQVAVTNPIPMVISKIA
jgi:hypothetical protein